MENGDCFNLFRFRSGEFDDFAVLSSSECKLNSSTSSQDKLLLLGLNTDVSSSEQSAEISFHQHWEYWILLQSHECNSNAGVVWFTSMVMVSLVNDQEEWLNQKHVEMWVDAGAVKTLAAVLSLEEVSFSYGLWWLSSQYIHRSSCGSQIIVYY